MSEFKVGDKVVFKSSQLSRSVKTVKEVFRCAGDTYLVWNKDGFHINLLRHTTPDEDAVGHRIDTKQIEDIGDDRDMSQHISPNCKAKDV